MTNNDMVREMMAHIAKIKGANSLAQSYVDLIKKFKNEDHKR